MTSWLVPRMALRVNKGVSRISKRCEWCLEEASFFVFMRRSEWLMMPFINTHLLFMLLDAL